MIWVLISLYLPSGVTIGRAAAPFTLPIIDGEEVHLKDFRNKVVVLNFWASWCSSCQGEVRGVESVWKRHKRTDVLFLGVNVQNDDEKDARNYIRKYGLTYPNGWDDGKIVQSYSVWGVPKTFIIGPKGRITYVHLGSIGAEVLSKKIGEARKGVVTEKEGRGPYESLDVVRIDEIAKLLDNARHTDQVPDHKPLPKDVYRVIDLHTLNAHQGKWVKIHMNNGTKREGKIMAVGHQMIELEQRFSAGSFSIEVPKGQISQVQLLVSNGSGRQKQ